METTRSGADGSASDGDLRPIVDGHTQQIENIHCRLDGLEKGQDGLMREVVALRAEGQARASATTSGFDRLGTQVFDLTRQLAAHTGAQEERNRIEQEKLQAARKKKIEAEENAARSAARTQIWQRALLLVSAIAAIGGMLFSSEHFDTAFWGHVHFRPKIESQTNATPNH
ncbi:hypothetical protein [Acetobacter indonesiensis]|uniref:hypothetical protein n=1 Tax=Acetobacter indonesiensis TaxID=104101 RepID=UPI0039E7A4E8